MKIQAIGVCRFSVITQRGFRSGPQDEHERVKYLFAEARMAIRMAWFKHVTLPSMRAQTDQDFTFVVLASTLMPLKWCDMLLELTDGVSNIEIDFVEPEIHHKVCNHALTSRVSPDADIVAQFRLDDDDALGNDYISRVRSDFLSYLQPLFAIKQAVSCDYTKGLILDADGVKSDLYTISAINWTCGQTVYLPPNAPVNLFTWGHYRMSAEMPSLTLNDSTMYLRGRNGTNDTDFNISRIMKETNDFAVLEERFSVNLDALQKELRSAR